MSLNTNNNKETFKLLDVSSDSDSDFLKVEIAPRRKRINRTRRIRNKPVTTHAWKERWGPRAAVLAASAALLAWLAALSWAAAALAADTHRLDLALREVSMGSQSVGDALQRCHTAAKELLHNHTEMAARLDQLVLRTDNLTTQAKTLHEGLEEVKRQVAGAPELVAVPQRLSDLQASVARFGSQLRDTDATVAALKAQATSQDDLHLNVSQLKTQIDQLWNKTETAVEHTDTKELKQQSELQATLQQLSTNMSLINQTLATKIDWAKQDFLRDHRNVLALLEAVQNNSAALSSLQTAWRQGNDVIARNISDMEQKLNEKSSDLQRQLAEVQQMQEKLASVQARLVVAPVPTLSSSSAPDAVLSPRNNGNPALALTLSSPPPGSGAGIAKQDSKDLHERDVRSIYDIPKMIPSTLPSQVIRGTKGATYTTRANGKPSILSAGTA